MDQSGPARGEALIIIGGRRTNGGEGPSIRARGQCHLINLEQRLTQRCVKWRYGAADHKEYPAGRSAAWRAGPPAE